MNWWHPDNFAKKKQNLLKRAEIIKAVRAWFDEQGFIEVQTPALQKMGAPDTHIKPFQTEGYELHSSPEIAMKKLLVAGIEQIYQICPVYRKGDHTKLHAQEFTMLEWYRTGVDYKAMMNDCENLIQSLGIFKNQTFEHLSVEEAFKKYANIDIFGDLKAQAIDADIRTIDSDTFEDIFHAIMAEKIEPNLGNDVPTILYDYPAPLASLAKKRGEVAERFELYINGIEIANAFTELTDPIEQKERLIEDLKEKETLYSIQSPLDEDFIAALKHGMPESSGCALGLDRLIIIACTADAIDEVLWTEKP